MDHITFSTKRRYNFAAQHSKPQMRDNKIRTDEPFNTKSKSISTAKLRQLQLDFEGRNIFGDDNNLC